MKLKPSSEFYIHSGIETILYLILVKIFYADISGRGFWVEMKMCNYNTVLI